MASVQQNGKAFRAVVRHHDYYESKSFQTREQAEGWAAVVEDAYRRSKADDFSVVGKPATLGLLPLMPTPDSVRAAAAPAEFDGVYFLLQGDEVVYVGQSRNVLYRLAEHVRHNGYGRDFDRYAVVPCPGPMRLRVEQHYLTLLRPRFNTNGLPRD